MSDILDVTFQKWMSHFKNGCQTFQKWMSYILDVTFRKWMSDLSKNGCQTKMDVRPKWMSDIQKWMSDIQKWTKMDVMMSDIQKWRHSKMEPLALQVFPTPFQILMLHSLYIRSVTCRLMLWTRRLSATLTRVQTHDVIFPVTDVMSGNQSHDLSLL